MGNVDAPATLKRRGVLRLNTECRVGVKKHKTAARRIAMETGARPRRKRLRRANSVASGARTIQYWFEKLARRNIWICSMWLLGGCKLLASPDATVKITA